MGQIPDVDGPAFVNPQDQVGRAGRLPRDQDGGDLAVEVGIQHRQIPAQEPIVQRGAGPAAHAAHQRLGPGPPSPPFGAHLADPPLEDLDRDDAFRHVLRGQIHAAGHVPVPAQPLRQFGGQPSEVGQRRFTPLVRGDQALEFLRGDQDRPLDADRPDREGA